MDQLMNMVSSLWAIAGGMLILIFKVKMLFSLDGYRGSSNTNVSVQKNL